MNKINYQKQLDKVIENLGETKPTLLLHSCCAPCSSYVMEYLSQYFDITIDYYNPNIDSKEEYEKRVYKKVWMDIAWYCGRNGRRIFVLAVCRLHHWDLPYHFFSCQQFHLGGGNGGIVAQFIYAGA